MTWSEERLARAGLCAAVSLADPQLSGVVAEYGACAAWDRLRDRRRDSALARRAQAVDLDAMVAATSRHRCRFITPGDAEWPPQMDDLVHAEPTGGMGGSPFGLWVSGGADLAEWAATSVAIVGARSCTAYGAGVASELAYELADAEFTVVSGGAYGIDIAAHDGAIAAAGRTVAVLANGVDLLYPRGNASSLMRVRRDGLVVSELPPGSEPSRAGFLARNRIIAALASGTIIVEAAARSGARNTATWALSLGRPVMAVPGPVTSSASATPHQLIRDGAAVLVACGLDVRAVLAPMGESPLVALRGGDRLLDDLPAREAQVREALPRRGARSIGEISVRTGMPVAACVTALGELETLGLAARTYEGAWRLARPLA